MGAPQPSTPRAVLGTLLRSMPAALKELGFYDAVKARLPEETARLLERPPLPVTWLPAVHFDRLLAATQDVGGREGLHRMALLNTRLGPGPMVLPVMKAATSILGATPLGVLQNASMPVNLLLRGTDVSTERTGPQSCEFRLHLSEPADPAFFVGVEGSLPFIYEVCGCKGTVTLRETSADHRWGMMAFEWAA